MDIRSFIGYELTIQIDRPLGSRHPWLGFIYPVNYGFLPGTQAPDGDEIDAYLLGVFTPVSEFTGICVAVLHRLDDDDDKLIVLPPGTMYDDLQITALTEFQERFFQTTILRR